MGNADMFKRSLLPNPQFPYVPFPKIDLPEDASASHQYSVPLSTFTIILFLLYKKENILLTHPKPCYGALFPTHPCG